MKKFLPLFIILTLCLSLAACGGSGGNAGSSPAVQLNEIKLNGSSATVNGKGVSVSSNVVTISSEGEYHLSGTLDDGQIIVDTGTADAKVILYMDNAQVTCLSAPAIYVLQAKSLHIVLPEGSSSRLVSGSESDMSSYDGTANGGAIFAEDDVDFEGEGSLEILGYLNNGITCKDDVKIEGGKLSILAANNGIKGSESVSVYGGSVDIDAGNDGIKATSATKEGKGYVLVEGGSVSVKCNADGISAETDLTINGGSVSVVSNGDPVQGSCKGIKGKTGVVINGGSVDIVSPDHSIHSAAGVSLTGGTVSAVSTQGKCVAAHGNIDITGGALDFNSFDDGIETAADINISGGSLMIVSGNDGIHAGEKADGVVSATGIITVSGGTVISDAVADPVDAKDKAIISGGSFFGTGSPKNAKLFESNGQSFAYSGFSGSADTELTVSGEGFSVSVRPSQSFTFLLVSEAGMSSGLECTATDGTHTVNLTCQ